MKFKYMLYRVITLVVMSAFIGFYSVPDVATAMTSETSTNVQSAAVSKIKGSEVLVIGDSFLALSRDIVRRLEQNAKSEGVLDSSDKFRDNSVSGTMLSGGISPTIPTQYQNGVNAGAVKYVIMDGGGNDCLAGNVDNAVTAARTLVGQMGRSGTVKLFYLFYPDPVGGLAGSLKPKLDTLRPQIQSIVTSSTAPKGYFLDLRPTFEGKYSSYIMSDGIHPTQAGSYAAADAIWAEMKRIKFFESNELIYGDINNDSSVDALDFSLFKQYLMDPQHAYNIVVDLNVDNTVDSVDYSILKQYLLGKIKTLPYK